MSFMKSPAFQFYAAEYLADEHVELMSLEEEGAYIRLLAYCWREGSIPADVESLSRLCKGASTTLVSKLLPRFKRSVANGSRLVHARLEAERIKQQSWREKSARGGRASARKRKHPQEISPEQGGSTTVPPTRLNGGSALQSSSSSSNSNTPADAGRGLSVRFADLVEFKGWERKEANSFLGRCLKDYPKAEVEAAVAQAIGADAADPKAYVMGILNGAARRPITKAEMNRAGGKVVL